MLVTGGDTNVTAYLQMRLLTGGDATGLTITDFDLTYTRSGATPAAKADATDLGSANAAHSDNGGYEVDPTDTPGLHRFDFPDTAFAAGVREVVLSVKHAVCFTETLRCTIDAEVNVTKVSDDSDAADNMESQFDGTGYAHDTAPSTQIQLAGLAGGLAVQAAAESSVVTQGTETNTYAVTATHDGTEYIVTDSEAGVGIDFYLQFDLVAGMAVPVDFHIHGYFEDQAGPDKSLAIQAFNWNTSAWETIEILTGAMGEQTHEPPLNNHHVKDEIVRIRFLHSASEAGNAMHIDHCTVGYVTSLQVDDDGFVKVSSGTGTGQLQLDSGVVDANVVKVLGIAANAINVIPLIPGEIDLADTATWRIGLMLTNAWDDLPTTGEITVGTIAIDRKAPGGTSWTNIVNDVACSEIAGLIYYDEVFDTGTGYAQGDSIRVTFKAQKVVVGGNDIEIIGATGRIFYTRIWSRPRGIASLS